MVHKWAAAATLAAMSAAVPAQAQAHCWNEREAAAAQVRELQIKLMVAALRCRAARMDITADYDDFVASQRSALDHASFVIKQHFAAEGGTQADYDRFGTSLANGYGDDATTDGSCAEAAMIAHDASMIAPVTLEPFAAARLFPASLPGGRCGMMPAVAQAVPAPVAASVVAAAPPPPPVPAEVAMAAAAPVAIPAPRAPANLPIVHPDAAPIVPIEASADEPNLPAPVAVAQAAPVAASDLVAAAPAPTPARVLLAQATPVQGPSLPADVLAAMAVLARYQQSLRAAASEQH